VSDLEDLRAAARTAPTTVGVLVVAGLPEHEASAHVERELVRGVRGGMVGGTELGRELALAALERAPAPTGAQAPGPPPTAVEDAVRTLPWPERVATVAAAVFGPTTRLGPGHPEVVASAVGARVPSWAEPADPAQPSVVDLLAAAVEQRAPDPDPGLAGRLERVAGSPARPRTLLVAALVALAVLAIVAGFALWQPWAGESSGSRSDDGMRIRQWVAVLDTGPSPASLAGQAADLGRVVGVYVFTDRWACYDGFPGGQLGDDPWFLGIGAVDRATVEELVEEAGREPLLLSEVFQTCVLPPPSDFPRQP
jgi:hypothetical protein